MSAESGTLDAAGDLATEEKQDRIIELLDPPKDYFVEVVRGNVPGHRLFNITGANTNMTAGSFENVWDQGGTYTYLTADTALFISSSDAGDTQTVVVNGMDDTYTEVTRTATLSGQSQVALDDDLFRVFSAFVLSPTPTSGDVYIAESDTLTGGVPDDETKIKAKIMQEFQSTQMAQYTVPLGKTGYALFASYTTGKNSDTDHRPRVRPFGLQFYTNVAFDLYQNSYQANIIGATTLNERTDFDFTAKTDLPGAQTAVALKFLLIDNDVE